MPDGSASRTQFVGGEVGVKCGVQRVGLAAEERELAAERTFSTTQKPRRA